MLTKKTIFFFFLISVSLTFYRLPQAFFQQDEWATFGMMAIFDQAPIQALQILLPRTLLDHFVPSTFLVDYLQHKLFNLQFAPYAFFSLSLHLINSILVYYFFKLLSKKQDLSLAASLIFATNSLGHQAVTWISTSTSTQGATLFGLISLILFTLYLESDQKRLRLLSLSLLSFLISLTFKENSIFIFLFLPFFLFLFARKGSPSQFKKLFSALFITFLVYLLLRGLVIISLPPVTNIPITEKSNPPLLANLLYRLLINSFRTIPQSLLTTNFLLKLAQSFVFWNYPNFVAADGVPNPYLVESVGFDLICFVMTVVILTFAFFVSKSFQKTKAKELIQLLIFSLSFIVISASPFVFILGPAGYASIFEPRNLYLISVGSSFFLALIILGLSDWLSQKTTISTRSLFLFFLALLLLIHIKNIRNDIDQLVSVSQLRKSILNQIIADYPHLPEKVIFYTESDATYYGLPDEEKILPFQTGFGQTLLIWYHQHDNKFPLCMFTNQYEWLYQIEDQGYQYCQGRGFGYFRKMNELKTALKENNLSTESVIAFQFRAKDNSLEDIAEKIRKRLK